MVYSNRILFFITLAWVFTETISSKNQSLDETEILLQQLCCITAPSGFESDVRDFLIKRWSKKVKDVSTDNLGNVFFYINCKKDNQSLPTIALMAHMDEVGLMVKSISNDGHILFNPIGGWLEVALLAQKWFIKTEKGNVLGFSGLESAHISGVYPHVEKTPIRKMFIDIGASSKEEAEKMGIRPGLAIAPYPSFEKIGPNGSRYLAKSMDDRVCLLVMDQLIEKLQDKMLDVNVVFVATVQEELGLRGAKIVANTIKPNIILNLDVSIAKDFPLQTTEPEDGTKLGKGPAIFVYDGSMIPDQNLLSYVIEISQKQKLSYQFDSMACYGQDGAAVQSMLNGVSAINIGIPCRYAHSQGSIVDRFDIDETVKLLKAVLQDLNLNKTTKIISKGIGLD
ncbi:MAG: M42 family metallopeptidase [Candidatus Babeliales bacterium]